MKKLLLTTTIAAGIAFSASATEAGKMYVRGDVGYQFSGSKTDALKAVGATNNGGRLKGFTGDVGFGYAIADNIRTDLTVNFSNPSSKQTNKLDTNAAGATQKVVTYVDADAVAKAQAKLTAAGGAYTSGSAPTTDPRVVANTELLTAQRGKSFDLTQDHTSTTKNKSIGLLANVYYDFATGSSFTPYVMGGVGLDRTNQEFSFTGSNNSSGISAAAGISNAVAAGSGTDSFKIQSKNKNSFAYQVGLGVGVEVAKDVVLDVGYKLSGHSGNEYVYKIKQGGQFIYGTAADNTYSQTKDFKTKSSRLSHSLTAGVRFAF